MAAPSITSFTPSAAKPGQAVVITGTGFTGTVSVVFGTDQAYTFHVDSDTQITALPNIDGDGSITVTNLDGQATKTGFTLIVVKVHIGDLPPLARNVNDNDLFYVYDSIRDILCNATGLQVGANGSGGGSGSGDITPTAFGSPFKVRRTDGNYSDNGTDTTITDLRLQGKADYLVYASDLNIEFENYLADGLTASATGVTSASNGTYNNCKALNLTGIGDGSVWNVVANATHITSISLVSGGQGYNVGDTFVLDETPGIVYTIATLGTNYQGNLLYDPDNGILTIKNYILTAGRHISISCNGVETQSQNNLTQKLATYDKVLAPILSTLVGNGKSGIVLPWRLPANLIPDGWQECLDFRGRIPMGQDPGDNADPTDLENLSQAINTAIGFRQQTLTAANIPELTTEGDFQNAAGTALNGFAAGRTGGNRPIVVNPKSGAPTTPISTLSPVRIVQWIEYIG